MCRIFIGTLGDSPEERAGEHILRERELGKPVHINSSLPDVNGIVKLIRNKEREAQIRRNRKVMTVPVIDGIDMTTWEYQ
uniref:Uncharacterized protein n=1 Tax=Panagrolaimus davidi TaxID=227884 RepID=A0A914QV35_9BILA